MKTLKLVLNYLLLNTIGVSLLTAQGLNLPDLKSLEQEAREDGVLIEGINVDSIVFTDGDFDPPARGLLRKADIKVMTSLHERIGKSLMVTPAAEKQTNAAVVKALQTLHEALGKVLGSGKEADFFPVIPQLVDFQERIWEEANALGPELSSASTCMFECGTYLVRALAFHIENEQGVVSDDLLRRAVTLFSNSTLMDESAWDEDERIPVNSSGLFILNPELVVEEVKRRPLNRVTRFLRNIREPEDFFKSYAVDGDGLEVLKAKYAANKEVLDAKYRELVAWWQAQPGK